MKKKAKSFNKKYKFIILYKKDIEKILDLITQVNKDINIDLDDLYDNIFESKQEFQNFCKKVRNKKSYRAFISTSCHSIKLSLEGYCVFLYSSDYDDNNVHYKIVTEIDRFLISKTHKFMCFVDSPYYLGIFFLFFIIAKVSGLSEQYVVSYISIPLIIGQLLLFSITIKKVVLKLYDKESLKDYWINHKNQIIISVIVALIVVVVELIAIKYFF